MGTGCSLADDEPKVVVAPSGSGGACGRWYLESALADFAGRWLVGVVAALAVPEVGEKVCGGPTA